MAITYPLSLPSSPQARAIEMRLVRVVARSRSPFSSQIQVHRHPGEWWEASIDLPPMERADAAAWIAFLASLRGSFGTFRLGDLAAPTPRGSAAGTPLVAGASQTGNVLIVDGWDPVEANVMRAGDYFELESNLYMAVKDATSDSAGETSLDIEPALRSTPADNAALTTSSARGTFRLADNSLVWSVGEAKIYGIQFDAIEAV